MNFSSSSNLKKENDQDKDNASSVVIDLIAEENEKASSSSSFAPFHGFYIGQKRLISLIDDEDEDEDDVDKNDRDHDHDIEVDIEEDENKIFGVKHPGMLFHCTKSPTKVHNTTPASKEVATESTSEEDKYILPIYTYQNRIDFCCRIDTGLPVQKMKTFLQELKAQTVFRQHKIDVNKCLNIHKGATPLILATKEKNFPMVKYFVEELHADVNVTSRMSGESAIGWAALNLDVATADYLIAKGANVNTVNYLGQSPLSFATKNGDYDFVMKLVEKGADCSILDQSGNTLLTLAAVSGSLKLLDFYINNGLNLNAQNYEGETVLMKIAKLNNKRHVLLHLLNQNVNLDLKDHEGKTALDFANTKSNKLLISHKMKEKIPSVVYNALKRKQSEAEEEPAVATPVAESSGSSSNPPVATTVPIVTTKVEESNQTTTPSLELFPEKAKLVDEVSQQHHHLLERIHLYEGKSETIEHTLLTIASCEDLIIKLEHSIDRVKEHKSKLEEEERIKKRKAEEAEDEVTCVLCLDAKKEAVATPCGHISMCLPCISAVMARDRKCPICRIKIAKYYKIYN